LIASKEVVYRENVIVVVWDGKKARGKGEIKDIMEYAKGLSKRVMVINVNQR